MATYKKQGKVYIVKLDGFVILATNDRERAIRATIQLNHVKQYQD